MTEMTAETQVTREIHVLLIEDDPDDVILIQHFLEGFHPDLPVVTLAYRHRLREGIAYLALHKVDVILLDLSLPDGRGLETISQMLSAASDTPIIVLTDLNDESTAIRALREGVHDYLVKGKVDGDLLMRTICYAIERFQHITKIRRIEQLKSEITEQRRISELKDEFVSAVSHELRTPLTIIQNAVVNLRDGIAGPLSEEQAMIVAVTNRNCERLAKLINDLLDLSRLESGELKLCCRQLDPGSFFAETMTGFKTLASERGISLSLELADNLPTLSVDSDMIVQVLNNLIHNALRFAKAQVILRVQATQSASAGVQISVIDDGMGMSPKDMAIIFNKFAQVNRPMGGDGYKGTGLGLVICKDIIELHQGRIWVESEVGAGAQFHFFLPVTAHATDKGHDAI